MLSGVEAKGDKMFRMSKKGQTALEYLIILTLVLGAFVAAGTYVKRGLQGRWKAAVDDLGDQYDPRTGDTYVIHRIVSNTETIIDRKSVV